MNPPEMTTFLILSYVLMCCVLTMYVYYLQLPVVTMMLSVLSCSLHYCQMPMSLSPQLGQISLRPIGLACVTLCHQFAGSLNLPIIVNPSRSTGTSFYCLLMKVYASLFLYSSLLDTLLVLKFTVFVWGNCVPRSWYEKRWKRAGRNGEVKNCSSDTTCLHAVAQWDPRPATCCWMTVKSRRPDKNPSKAKKQDYFKGVFLWIISLYCIVIFDLAKFVLTPNWK